MVNYYDKKAQMKMNRFDTIQYPPHCVDIVDKLIFCLFLPIEGEEPDKYTINIITKHVLSELAKRIGQGLTVEDKIKKLVLEGKLKIQKEQKELELISIN